MNFFEQQDIARRNTRWLIILFALAVISLIALTALLFAAVFAYLETGHMPYVPEGAPQGFGARVLEKLDWTMTGIIAACVCTVVLLSSLLKFFQLRGGGKAVAEAMGGQRINQQTTNADERKILNIVEEMAIASGAPVPPVYILEDDAINAFAAGHNPHNAVIGVTRGCIRLLSRDELQGVVAHEFSHIFHGDMRLNLRLVAILHGILVLGLVGQYLLESSRYRMAFRSQKDNSPMVLFGMGLALLIIGYAGTFFGNLIKAAVSRQREFLADASAVQFTRNPDGIAGALKKIRAHSYGSRLQNAHASEFSHMYFSQGIKAGFAGLMATHPPLDTRIKRIDRYWNPTGTAPQQTASTNSNNEAASQFAPDSGTAAQPDLLASALASTGSTTPAYLAGAQTLLAAIGSTLHQATQDSFLNRAVLLGLFLSADPTIRARQLQSLKPLLDQDEDRRFEATATSSAVVAARLRLPLIELALPGLKQLTDAQLAEFTGILDALIRADNKISLMEWCLQRIILHSLEPAAPQFRTRQLRDLTGDCLVVLSFLAFSGTPDDRQASEAFAAALGELRLPSLQLPSRGYYNFESLDRALDNLNQLPPLQKPALLKAMSLCIRHDGKVTVSERELLRAIADGLDCPMPPLVTPGPATGPVYLPAPRETD